MLRGGATRQPDVKDAIKAAGFRWDGRSHAWTTYLDRSDLGPILVDLRDRLGCEVEPKAGMDESYLLDLDAPRPAR
jgi:hypothetical protein